MNFSSRSKSTGQIKVYRTDCIKELMQDAPRKKALSVDDSYVRYPSSITQKTQSNLDQQNSTLHVNGWLSRKSITSIQEKTDYESKNITNMYLSLLDDEKVLQKDLDEIIDNDMKTKSRKLQWLLERWYENTYIPLENKINEEMNGVSFKRLDRKKRKKFIDYLNHRSKKGHVFLDTFEEDEYDPLSFNRHRPGPIKNDHKFSFVISNECLLPCCCPNASCCYSTHSLSFLIAVTERLQDPLLHQQNKRNEEDRIEVACDTGTYLTDAEIGERRLPPQPLVPLGRHGMHYTALLNDIQSDARVRSQERFHGIRNCSTECLLALREGDEENAQLTNLKRKDTRWNSKKQFPENLITTMEFA